MHVLTSLLVLLVATLHAQAVTLTVSSIYMLTVGNKALSHSAANSSLLTAVTISTSATNQMWSIVVNRQTQAVTVQNVETRDFMSPAVTQAGSAVVATSQPFSWNIAVTLSQQNLLCVSTSAEPNGPCISAVSSTGQLLLAPRSFVDPTQQLNAVPVPPPNGGYMVHNEAHGTVLGAGFPISPATLDPFPATDRHDIWFVTREGDTGLEIGNFDTSAPLSVNGSSVVVGASQVLWNWVFVQGIGSLLVSPNAPPGELEVLTSGPVRTKAQLGLAISADASWVFLPVNLVDFEP